MTSISDFNQIDKCDMISPDCIDAEMRLEQSGDTTICMYTSWGDACVDLEEIVKNAETCTTLYLSPDENPNCLVYEPECGDNICITGDELSRIISMTKLKDVDQSVTFANGDVLVYDGTSHTFKTYNLGNFLTNYDTTMNNLNNRITQILNKLTPPADAPNNVSVVFGNINSYADPNVVINEGSGTVTTLNKNHGLYTHTLSTDAFGDQIFG